MSGHSCTHSRVPVCSPFFRKSKIAVSLNSFPLAAQTAFVLQTKRKRNETEGSEEAGEGGRERVRAKEQTEKEGNAEAEPDKGKSEAPEEEPTARDRQEGWGLHGKQPSPPSTRTWVSPQQNLKDATQQSPFPTKSTRRGDLQVGKMPGIREISLPTTLAPCGDMPQPKAPDPQREHRVIFSRKPSPPASSCRNPQPGEWPLTSFPPPTHACCPRGRPHWKGCP